MIFVKTNTVPQTVPMGCTHGNSKDCEAVKSLGFGVLGLPLILGTCVSNSIAQN